MQVMAVVAIIELVLLSKKANGAILLLVALIVIILAVVFIFRNKLSTIVKTAGSKVVKWINAN